jgi:hypothetical protein
MAATSGVAKLFTETHATYVQRSTGGAALAVWGDINEERK